MTETQAATSENLLDRVRKLLAKAEADGVTQQEAEALTAKAAELMAKYGIQRAQLGALRPESDKPVNRRLSSDNPWGDVKRHLLAGLASALRCECINPGGERNVLHVFGYQSDIDRAEILWTSVQVQMFHALARQDVARTGGSAKAWRRSWMLGYCSAVVGRVRAAEEAAVKDADEFWGPAQAASGRSTALVLADRSLVIKTSVQQVYPRLRKTRVTYSGGGYGDGYQAGQKADIGGGKVGSGSGRAIGR
jgi:hypothetical protein